MAAPYVYNIPSKVTESQTRFKFLTLFLSLCLPLLIPSQLSQFPHFFQAGNAFIQFWQNVMKDRIHEVHNLYMNDSVLSIGPAAIDGSYESVHGDQVHCGHALSVPTSYGTFLCTIYEDVIQQLDTCK